MRSAAFSAAVAFALAHTAGALSCSEWGARSDTPEKSALWQAVSFGDVDYVRKVVAEEPCAAKARAADGRGPLFWAMEFSQSALAEELVAAGADPEARDKDGLAARDLLNKSAPFQRDEPPKHDFKDYDPTDDEDDWDDDDFVDDALDREMSGAGAKQDL